MRALAALLRVATVAGVTACARVPTPRPAAPEPAAPPPPSAPGPAPSSETTPVAETGAPRRTDQLSPSAETAEPAPAPAPPPLPAGTTLLHIGDSFAGALGIDLNLELKAAGIRGVLKYQTATYIPTWASGKELETYLWKYHPDLVLITLGANELEIPDPEQRAPTIRRLVGRLGGRPCVWIGPPLWEGARPALLETIRTNIAPCLYLDSTALLPGLARARDHIHPSMQARKIWAKAVIEWLARHRVDGAARPWELRE